MNLLKFLYICTLIGLSFAFKESNLTNQNNFHLIVTNNELVVGEQVEIQLQLLQDLPAPISVYPDYEWLEPVLQCEQCGPYKVQYANTSLKFVWTTLKPSVMTIIFKCMNEFSNNSTEINSNSSCIANTKGIFAQIKIGRSRLLHTFSWIFGWIYFFSWVLSVYPQVIINYKRKSVVGLHFDFVSLCFVGFFSYAVFNVCLYYIPMFYHEYEHLHPYSNLPVQVNDVLFAVHNTLILAITGFQCFIYERGDQKICDSVKMMLNTSFSTSILLICFLCLGEIRPLAFAYFMSYLKIVLTLAKYIPQAVFNYRRKSTHGWSIHNILLDLNGGILSLGQMVLLSINFNNANYFTDNLAKLGIGLVTLVMDSIFIVQHYYLYPEGKRRSLHEEDSQSSLDTNSECTKNSLSPIGRALNNCPPLVYSNPLVTSNEDTNKNTHNQC